MIDREAREGVLRELIKKNQIPVASSLVERAVEMQYQRLRQMLGMKPERNDPTAGLTDELREKMRPAGADEVRGQLLLEAIADKENIAVTDDELGKHIEETAKSRNVAGREAARRVAARRPASTTSRTRCARTRSSSSSSSKRAVTEVEKLSQPGTPVPERRPPRTAKRATSTAPTATIDPRGPARDHRTGSGWTW